ncbi:ABC transporter ATP-binding protein [Paenibacillus sp. MBLB4367]|uniref:ABC transporter ATP-binding protein n=1 Tax=Paenibacillus sp. MBLB4367 TaxID=3384767 RepID=UPI00390840A3
MIRVRGLTKTFQTAEGLVPVLDIPAWDAARGSRLAIVGPSGCGKSTLLHMLSGMVKADAGETVVDGQPLHKLKEAERDAFRASRIGYVMQDFHLLPALTAKQNVELVMERSSSGDKKKRLEQWFERIGLAERMNHLPSQLSRGQQQRVAVVRALINRPPLVLADEPTGSLDWETANDVMALLLSLCKDDGLTLITVTHDLHLAKRFDGCVSMDEINRLHRTAGKSYSASEMSVVSGS